MRMSLSNILRVVFTIILTVLGILFFRSTSHEVRSGYDILKQANGWYVIGCAILTIALILSQAYAFCLCYNSIGKEVSLTKCISLFLKRFFLSPFIPGGFSVAQYTLNQDLEEYNITKSENAFVSTSFILGGQFSYVLILVPTFLITIYNGTIQDSSQLYNGLIIFAVAVFILCLVLYLFRRELLSKLRVWLHPHVGSFNIRPIIEAVAFSLMADIFGILTLWTALRAIGVDGNLVTASMGYIITIFIITLSPLFQGLVVVEGALVFTLKALGVDESQAIAGALVFRSFQLWMPLILGGIVYIVPIMLRWLKKGHAHLTQS